jgi:hypothetical protein
VIPTRKRILRGQGREGDAHVDSNGDFVVRRGRGRFKDCKDWHVGKAGGTEVNAIRVIRSTEFFGLILGLIGDQGGVRLGLHNLS